MTTIRLANAAEKWAPDAPDAEWTGTPAGPANAPQPPIDASPILMRSAHSRRAIPGFDGEEGEPFDIDELVQRVEDAAAEARRSWPDIWPAPQRHAEERDGAMDDPRRALAARREIAGLQEVRQKQTAALGRARDEIVELGNTAKLLRAKLAQKDEETAAAQQAEQRAGEDNAVLRAKLAQKEKETAAAQEAEQRAGEDNAALRAELEQSNTNFAELLRQTAELRSAFEQREKEMTAMRARVAALKQELSVQAAGNADLSAAIADAKARYYKDFDKRTAAFEAETEKLARMLGAREERIRNLEDDNVQMAARCEGLARRATDFEAGKKQAEEKLEAQTAMVGFLDATLQAEREATGRKIAALTAALQRERLARAADAREAAMVCKEIGRVLPRLARQPHSTLEAIERAMDTAADDPAAPPATAA